MREVQLHWQDEDGKTAVHSTHVPDATDISTTALLDFCTAAADCSAAKLYKVTLRTVYSITDTPDTDEPYDISDKAVLTAYTVLGKVLKIVVAGPLESIFLNSDVVDMGNVLVEALVDALVGSFGHPNGIDGDVIASVTKGVRDRIQRGKYTTA